MFVPILVLMWYLCLWFHLISDFCSFLSRIIQPPPCYAVLHQVMLWHSCRSICFAVLSIFVYLRKVINNVCVWVCFRYLFEHHFSIISLETHARCINKNIYIFIMQMLSDHFIQFKIQIFMLVIVSNFPHTAPLFLNIIPMFGVEVCSHQYIVIPTYDFKSCRECSRPFSGGMFGCNSP